MQYYGSKELDASLLALPLVGFLPGERLLHAPLQGVWSHGKAIPVSDWLEASWPIPWDSVRFPNESDEYRAARIELLKAEIDLRRQIEEVAARRRRLPLGGAIAEDYVLEEGPRDLRSPETVKQVRFSQLFEPGKDALIVYSFMYGPQMEKPCPMCTSMLDGLDGQAQHVTQRINLVVAAKAPIRLIPRARARARLDGVAARIDGRHHLQPRLSRRDR